MSDELKPCPFCGIIGRVHTWTPLGKPVQRYGCAPCNVFKTTAEAWNRRAQPAEEVQPVGEVFDEFVGCGIRTAAARWYVKGPEAGTKLYTQPPAVEARPKDCTGNPQCCPQNEGHGCHCSPLATKDKP